MPGVATVAVFVHDKNPEDKRHTSFFYFLMNNSYEIDETDEFWKSFQISAFNANLFFFGHKYEGSLTSLGCESDRNLLWSELFLGQCIAQVQLHECGLFSWM